MYNLKKSIFTALVVAVVTLFGATTSFASGINFGNNSSEWSYDGECDDPRFGGAGMASVLLDEDIARDAADCRSLFNQGRVHLLGGVGDRIDFGSNSSEWANDGECDDPRFGGAGMASVLLDEDISHDANDCRSLYQAGRIYLR